jgi:ketosteroid isomerase-like protein
VNRTIPGIIGLILMLIGMPVYCVDLEKERTAILDMDKSWSAAASEGLDVNLIVSFWAEDATLFPPGMPAIAGKEAIRKFVQDSYAMPGFSIQWVTEQVVVSSDGSMAYGTGTNQTTFDDPQGKKITVNGKAVTVWRKNSSGVWKCVIDIWNEDAGQGEKK